MAASPLPPPPPASELRARLAPVQAAMRADDIDALLLVQGADVVYLAGTAQNAHLVVPADGDPVLLVRRDLGRARAESGLERVEPFASLRALPDALAAAGIVPRPRLGLELDVLPAASYLRYRDLLPAATVVDAMPALWAGRSRKTAWELARIRLACRQSLAAVQAAPGLLRVGRLECDVLSELGSVMRAHGHEGTIRFRGLNHEFFFGQVLGGPTGAVPGPTETPLCGWGLSTAQGRGPTRRALCTGDSVVVDVSGIAEGYVSDQTRSFFVGEAPARMRDAYAACRAILAGCVALLRPGTPASAVYERGLEIATEAGFGDNFMGFGPARVRFVGHCIGLELNEPPYLARGWDEPLADGNVCAVEPKLVFPDVGAVGLENSYLVSADGPIQLTSGDEDALQVPA